MLRTCTKDALTLVRWLDSTSSNTNQLIFYSEDAIDNAGYAKFTELVAASEEYGGWPMVQKTWNGEKFSTEKVAGKNFRRFGINSLLTAYPSLDNFNTAQYILQAKRYTELSRHRMLTWDFAYKTG